MDKKIKFDQKIKINKISLSDKKLKFLNEVQLL